MGTKNSFNLIPPLTDAPPPPQRERERERLVIIRYYLPLLCVSQTRINVCFVVSYDQIRLKMFGSFLILLLRIKTKIHLYIYIYICL